MKFKVGLRGVYEVEISDAHMAHTQGNPDVRVLSTPTLTPFCEIAA